MNNTKHKRKMQKVTLVDLQSIEKSKTSLLAKTLLENIQIKDRLETNKVYTWVLIGFLAVTLITLFTR